MIQLGFLLSGAPIPVSQTVDAERVISALQAEMRQVFPCKGPYRSRALRDLRAQNQARFDAALRSRPRPSRVS